MTQDTEGIGKAFKEYWALKEQEQSLRSEETKIRNGINDVMKQQADLRKQIADWVRHIDKDLAQTIGIEAGLVYKDVPHA